jgi:hypothetical protein
MGETKNTYIILIGKPEGNKPFGRPWRRWEDNIIIYLREIEWKIWGLDSSVPG